MPSKSPSGQRRGRPPTRTLTDVADHLDALTHAALGDSLAARPTRLSPLPQALVRMEVPHLLQAVRPTPVTFGVLTLAGSASVQPVGARDGCTREQRARVVQIQLPQPNVAM